MISREGLSGRSRFFYNSKNQQIRTETEEGQVQENRYDAEGLRYEVRENANRIRFVYHQGELLYEKGGEESSYHLGGGTEAVWQSEKNHYYHQDEQLSTGFITNEKREIQNHYLYDAFGNGICQEEGISNRIRYTGQQYDGVTGQYYLRARYYNPILGRFLQEDEYQGDGLNLYAYCGNNPVRYYDPSGYSKTPEVYNTGCPGATTNGDAGKAEDGGITSDLAISNKKQVFSLKGYNPQPGERTINGYVKDNADPEISLITQSSGFNNNKKGIGGIFKRFGANVHAKIAPHVHQPQRNVRSDGTIYGKTGTKTSDGGVTSPSKRDVKQLYEYTSLQLLKFPKT